MAPSRKFESSPSKSPSPTKSSVDGGRVRKRTGSFGSRRAGRPTTAAQVWRSPRMKRNLIRLYYCTNIRTEVIGKVLSALASIKSGCSLKSGKRSTQIELQRLLSDERVRPKTREAVRQRIAWFRVVKDRKRVLTAYKNGVSILDVGETLSDVLSLPHKDSSVVPDRTTPTLVESVEVAPAALTSSETIAHQAVRESSSVRGGRLLHASVRSLSSRSRPSSSFLAEMRSLLSFSTDTSRSGRPSISPSSVSIGGSPSTAASEEHTRLVVEVCCGRRSECLHRKVVTAITERTGDPLQLPRVDFDPKDFHLDTGRTVLNETVLHIAARWRDRPVSLLCELVQRCTDELLNVKDYSGRTFVHLLDPGSIAGSVCLLFRTLQDKRFRWALRDASGDTCLASLVADTTTMRGLNISERMEFVAGFQNILQMLSEKNQSPLLSALFTPTSTGELTGRRIARFFEEIALWQMERGYGEAPSVSQLAGRYSDLVNEFIAAQNTQGESASQSDQSSFHAWLEMRDRSGPPGISRPVSFDDPNTYNNQGETCLMALIRAVAEGRLAEDTGITWLENLLWRGADLRLMDMRGNTALHHATYWCLPRIVEALVHHGASADMKNVANETPLDICIKKNSSARSDQTVVEYSKSFRVLVRLFDGSTRRTKRQHSSQNRNKLMTMLKRPSPLAVVEEGSLLSVL